MNTKKGNYNLEAFKVSVVISKLMFNFVTFKSASIKAQ